eukprot:1160134-Pelagomonas_calceolata.AAC.8
MELGLAITVDMPGKLCTSAHTFSEVPKKRWSLEGGASQGKLCGMRKHRSVALELDFTTSLHGARAHIHTRTYTRAHTFMGIVNFPHCCIPPPPSLSHLRTAKKYALLTAKNHACWYTVSVKDRMGVLAGALDGQHCNVCCASHTLAGHPSIAVLDVKQG